MISHTDSYQLQDLKRTLTKPIRDLELRLHPRVLLYRPSIEISIETQHYRLKTATRSSELIDLFRLRHQIFLEENEGHNAYEFDYDHFDFQCDHLLIEDKATNEVVGTYRVQSSQYVSSFYSSTEFNLDSFLHLEGGKLELGRACIAPDHRNGRVIDLLWRGIGEYSLMTGDRYLFGCSSVKELPQDAIEELKKYFSSRCDRESSLGAALEGVKVLPQFESNFEQLGRVCYLKVTDMIPSLLKSYMMAGAMVAAEPAHDNDFGCFDFFTVLDMQQVSSSFRRRYFSHLDDQLESVS